MRAWILIKVKPPMEHRVLELLQQERRITYGGVVFGAYDLIVEIEANDTRELEEVVDFIRRLPDVLESTTLIVTREFRRARRSHKES